MKKEFSFVLGVLAFLSFPAFAGSTKQAQIVKAASDRTCLEVDGKLSCTPKRSKHRAQNMSSQQVSKSDQAGAAADESGKNSEKPQAIEAEPAKN